jgi:hypothetical protein
LAQVTTDWAYKVFWDYARQPGSDTEGRLIWAKDVFTLSTEFCGDVVWSVDSATGRVAIVGDLNGAKDGSGGGGGDYLHVLYHEQIDDKRWGVFYNSNEPVACFRVYLPELPNNADSGGG